MTMQGSDLSGSRQQGSDEHGDSSNEQAFASSEAVGEASTRQAAQGGSGKGTADNLAHLRGNKTV